MPTGRSSSDDGAAGVSGPATADARPPRPVLRWIGRSTFILCAAAGVLLGLGFLWFIWRVPADEVALNRNADGIVALTGGAPRIPPAVQLLALRRAQPVFFHRAHPAAQPANL